MTLEDAVKASIKKYYDPDFNDEEESSLNKVSPNKYNHEYFDKFEEEILGEKKPKKK